MSWFLRKAEALLNQADQSGGKAVDIVKETLAEAKETLAERTATFPNLPGLPPVLQSLAGATKTSPPTSPQQRRQPQKRSQRSDSDGGDGRLDSYPTARKQRGELEREGAQLEDAGESLSSSRASP
eukprot:CAMPEP_0181350980 /NCGR_PEP_ID=MMETSP1106-20121128/1547_1 /TAXON_ID=81844 /ORGANISM="Mantoniella antarctica, Strain SL-175" /LENGTH=125 /DNA_ID=CAMNT_0023463473 /DNA_START=421 /DNA_END=795 /DNA_ORIENTATION=-